VANYKMLSSIGKHLLIIELFIFYLPGALQVTFVVHQLGQYNLSNNNNSMIIA